MKSIKTKLVFLYIALVFMVMVVSGTIMIVRVRFTEINNMEIELKEVAEITKENVIKKTDKPEQFAQLLKDMYVDMFSDISQQVQTFILSPNGAYYASSTMEDAFQVGNSINPAMIGNDSFTYGRKAPDKNGIFKTWCEYAYPVFDETGKQTYIIYTRTDMDKIKESQNTMGETIMFASVAALLLTAVVGSLVADTFTAPILRLTNKSVAIAKGDLYQEIKVSSDDEIGQLTESFNYMAQELGTTIERIESEKSKMEVLLSNMTDGVLAFDINGQLIHANGISYELLDIEQDKNLSFDKITDILKLELKDLTAATEESVREFVVSIGDKYINAIFSIYANKYNKVEGVIIVLQDFTKHKKLDNMRKEFVANVSHEIRTPITTIKGYAETMLDDDDLDKELSKQFLSVILSESDRMTFLVKDLLELSRYDNQQLKIEPIELNIIGVIKETIVGNRMEADKKNQTIVFEPEIDDAYIKADRGRIIQVLTNTISNAIKYSHKKGQIQIIITENEKYYIVDIKDQGMGIPKENLDRLFERFYRVDKARSRAMGGTGLGLPIAKEIMDIHEGSISVTSEISEGTNVRLKFNKNFDTNSINDDLLV